MMEKVTDLFKAFRNNEIAYDELFGALTRMLSEDPHFATHAIATLDNAQQLTPIPVTDFIQLRSQLENTAETFQQQETLQPETGVNAGDATRMFDAEEQTQRPDSGMAGAYDPTLIANPADFEKPPAATPPADTGAGTSTDQPDDATVIMPTPPRQKSATPSTTPPPTTPPPANPVSPTPAPPELDDQATLIASPAAPESSPVPRAPAAPEPEPVPTPRPTQKDKIVPVPVLAGLGVLGLAIVLALAFWPGEDTKPPGTASQPEPAEAPADPWQSAPAQPTAGTGSPAVTDPVYSDPVYTGPEYQIAEPGTTEPEAISPEEAPREPTGQITATEDTREPEMSETVFEEPVVKDEAYFMAQIKTATAADRLTPSDQQGTATYFLTELIRYDSNSDRISEARTLISKRHLELAKAAREKSQWDAAQQHLDDALKVRLPDSYLP